MATPVTAETGLRLVYPPADHQTTADRIFFIGTAAPDFPVTINGQAIDQRSPQGHFAPSLPLAVGANTFTLQQQDRSVAVTVTRIREQPTISAEMILDANYLIPSRPLARLPGELICLGAIAPPGGTVTVQLVNQTLALRPVLGNSQLPPNYAVLTGLTNPTPAQPNQHQGCLVANTPGNLGEPEFQLTLNGQTTSQAGNGAIEILDPENLAVVEVTSEQGAVRTGASTDFSRMTPLPRGTRATLTGREGDWVRLDYGGWIRSTEVKVVPNVALPLTTIRGITSRLVPGATEIIFPLETPVPLSVQQGDRTFTLTLFNTTAQTDTIRLDDNPIISRLDWQQAAPGRVNYTFSLKNSQQWGYSLRYEGTNLILKLRHPPALRSRNASNPQSLAGVRILLDPGHGETDLGAVGPNGYPEKDINLLISQMVRRELEAKGATVLMTREDDREIPLAERVQQINTGELTLALSIHYNALPDDGDALNTQGISTFWYHPQAHSLAVFLHNYLTQQLDRPSYGIYWNNLALTRPQATPTVLLELGFMINPEEFEWITNPEAQQKLAGAIAEGVNQWLYQSMPQ
ncbi:MAG: N-acetylmuramoyl-L-alanine amidase [Coleofasciculaceae cyanobacterium SM2_1_6]|nr:N-acetylmuramoyl-L-alanine amidase [Coleofasciculaceae cyanobacterium SM2_1_6]